MDSTGGEEPLNLTIKKRPVAIVPPSSINLDASRRTINNHFNNNNNNNNNNNYANNNIKTYDYPDEVPQDLSMRKNNKNTEENKLNNEKLIYEEQMKYYLDYNNHQDFCKHLYKNCEDDKNNYNKNYFADNLLKANIFKDVYKTSDFYENLSSKNLTSSTENFYSMLNHITEQKFLATLYMNSMLSMNMPYLNMQEMTGYDRNACNNSPTKNSILNNLLSKKTHNDFKSSPNFDTLIKNEMCDMGDLKTDIKMNHRYFPFFILRFSFAQLIYLFC